jgi:hypothetical protein
MRLILVSLCVSAILLAGCDSSESTAPGDQTTVATRVVVDQEFPPGIGGEPITYREAPSDESGTWQAAEINGVSVDIPTDSNWHVQIVQDPCFGDERYYILIEERVTGDRFRVDTVGATKVTSVSSDPTKFEPLTERILRSIEGEREEPVIVKTFGPHPTLATCAKEDPDEVPTLVVDDFTPPPSTGAPPLASTPLPQGDEVPE